MNKELMRLESIVYQYPGSGWKLEGCSLSLETGRVKAVIGPNGSGKSTLLKAAALVVKPLSGQVLLEGKDASALSHRARARLVGYLPQNVQADLDYTAGETAAMGRYARLRGAGFLERHDMDIVALCLEQTKTAHLRERAFSSLSGGERQRVLLASVLAQEPRVLLLDEPTSAMDMHHQVSFFRLLLVLAEKGMAVGVVTHDLNLASVFAHSLALMKDGRLVMEGPARDILTPENLREYYGQGMEVAPHPHLARPLVIPSWPQAGDQEDAP